MIKKLQKKFILINMLLITIVLLVVFTLLCYSNYSKNKGDSIQAMEHALERFQNQGEEMSAGFKRPPKAPSAVNKKGGKNPKIASSFTVSLKEDGTINEIQADAMNVSDSQAKKLVKAALKTKSSEGYLPSYQYRFLIKTLDSVERIAFVDCEREISSLTNLILLSFVIFLGSLFAFTIISIFLSRWALAPVEKAWEQQRQFIADASHELKTPLTVILANLGILSSHKEEKIKDEIRWLQNTKTEAERMKELLNDLLFLAKSDSARLPVISSAIDFSSTLWSCILPFESVAYEHGITLSEQIEDNVSVIGDESQLKQLTAILLDNACKYSKKGGKVLISLYKKQDKAIFEVTNRGTLISKEDLPHIFERFYRADKSRARQEGGYGLGLSIAKTIAENHGGKIKAVSDEQSGTAFTVTLPLFQKEHCL